MLNLLNISTDSWVINYVAENFTKIDEGILLSKKVFECNNPWLYLKYQILYECTKTCVTTYLVPIELELSELVAERVKSATNEVTDSKDIKIKIEENYLITNYVVKKMYRGNLFQPNFLNSHDYYDFYFNSNYSVFTDEWLTDWVSSESFARVEDIKAYLEKETYEPGDSLAPIYLMFAQHIYGFVGDINEGYAEHIMFKYLSVPYYFPYEWEIYEASR
jgi:hypothetical protein